MNIILKTPYSVGDLAPDESYPHAYITTFYVNVPGKTLSVSYEVGTLSEETVENPFGQWTKAPLVPAVTLQFSGNDMLPFLTTYPGDADIGGKDGVRPTPYLWEEVQAQLYTLIQKKDWRMAGSIV